MSGSRVNRGRPRRVSSIPSTLTGLIGTDSTRSACSVKPLVGPRPRQPAHPRRHLGYHLGERRPATARVIALPPPLQPHQDRPDPDPGAGHEDQSPPAHAPAPRASDSRAEVPHRGRVAGHHPHPHPHPPVVLTVHLDNPPPSTPSSADALSCSTVPVAPVDHASLARCMIFEDCGHTLELPPRHADKPWGSSLYQVGLVRRGGLTGGRSFR